MPWALNPPLTCIPGSCSQVSLENLFPFFFLKKRAKHKVGAVGDLDTGPGSSLLRCSFLECNGIKDQNWVYSFRLRFALVLVTLQAHETNNKAIYGGYLPSTHFSHHPSGDSVNWLFALFGTVEKLE